MNKDLLNDTSNTMTNDESSIFENLDFDFLDSTTFQPEDLTNLTDSTLDIKSLLEESWSKRKKRKKTKVPYNLAKKKNRIKNKIAKKSRRKNRKRKK